MSTITFDTLRFVERLEKAGVPREQAAAMAEAQKEALAEALDTTLATKTDIQELRQDLTKLGAELRGEMTTIKWMMGVLVALAIANFAKQFF
ncbi:MAG: CCDC90 family protein [Rhodocyclaceae bacterium]|nr:CCDC90 family protein [Rhodocyclaceae bacterium]